MKTVPAILIFLTTLVPSGAQDLASALHDHLVKLDQTTGKTVPYTLPADQKIEYFMIYHSAHWCAPCRHTTPAIVKFYNEVHAQHPQFEFIFVSADHDQAAMENYMDWAQMPWPALTWTQRDHIPAITALDPPAVPFLAMLDKDGKLLGASDIGGFNVGITKILNGLQERLGTEVYDVTERHGKTPPFILGIYLLAATFFTFILIRRFIKSRQPT